MADNFKIRCVPFLEALSADELAALEREILRRSFSKNQIIVTEDDQKPFLYIIETGRVKVVQSKPDGKEQTIAIHCRGDFFGEMGLLDGGTVPARIVAVEPTRLAFIGQREFDLHIAGNVRALKAVNALLCRRLRDSWMMLRVLRCCDAESRIRGILEHMASYCGVKDSRGTIIALSLTHQEIADYAALARETVSRALQRFTENGEITVIENRKIILTPLFNRDLQLQIKEPD